MLKQRIFLFSQLGTSQRYGVGKYVDEITSELKERVDEFDLVIVNIGIDSLTNVKIDIKQNITFLSIPLPFSISKSDDYSLSNKFFKAVFFLLNNTFSFNEKTDLIHFNGTAYYDLIREIKKRTAIKILYTIHISLWRTCYNHDFDRFISDWNDAECKTSTKYIIKLEHEILKNVDRIICLSEEVENYVLNFLNIPKRKVKKVENGISCKREMIDNKYLTNVKKRLDIKVDDFVFLYVGRLIKQKGIFDLINAMKRFSREGINNIKLIIIGDGGERESVISLCTNEIEDKVLFTGYINPKNIKYYYSIANAVVFPSLNEQSSYTMLEAMLFKTPIIVTDISAFKMLEHEATCLKVNLIDRNTLNEESLYSLMKNLIFDEGLRFKLAKNAFSLLQNKFNTKLMIDKTYRGEDTGL